MPIYYYKQYGELGYLASYSDHGFYKNGIFYKTVEHYYQSEKMLDESVKNEIINVDTPKQASYIGRDRSNLQKKNWSKIKNKVMYDATLMKFSQNEDIKQKLLATKNQKIIEETVDEYYWGCGKDHSGKNIYGKILVKVREQLKKDFVTDLLTNKEVYIFSDKKESFDSNLACDLLNSIMNKNSIKSSVLNSTDNIDNKNLILIDTYLNNKNIKAIISSDIYNKNGIYIPYSSTSLLIYVLFKNIYQFNDSEKKHIYDATIMKCGSLKNVRKEDKILLKILIKK